MISIVTIVAKSNHSGHMFASPEPQIVYEPYVPFVRTLAAFLGSLYNRLFHTSSHSLFQRLPQITLSPRPYLISSIIAEHLRCS